jgi:N-dimethylarginine dimethylaminohydrolase
MSNPVTAHSLSTQGCYSEVGKLRKVLMCAPTYFQITQPINMIQLMWSYDGLPRPDPGIMVLQHNRFVRLLQEHGVEVELLPPVKDLPFQHATRDVGTVIGDTIVLANLRPPSRRLEADITRPTLEKSGLRVLVPDKGYVEGGDLVVDNGKLWVGIGGRTNEAGAEWLDETFGREYEVIPLYFDPWLMHLDTVFGALSRGHALVYENAFEAASLGRIRAAYPSIVSLTKEEQKTGGANVLPIDSDMIIAIAENASVNVQLARLGFDVITLPYSEIIKTGGSVRCDTLPVERD